MKFFKIEWNQIQREMKIPRHAIQQSIFSFDSILWEWMESMKSWCWRRMAQRGRDGEWVWLVFLWGVMGGRRCRTAPQRKRQAKQTHSSARLWLLSFLQLTKKRSELTRKDSTSEANNPFILSSTKLAERGVRELVGYGRSPSAAQTTPFN